MQIDEMPLYEVLVPRVEMLRVQLRAPNAEMAKEMAANHEGRLIGRATEIPMIVIPPDDPTEWGMAWHVKEIAEFAPKGK